jgi:hypothetical protein
MEQSSGDSSASQRASLFERVAHNAEVQVRLNVFLAIVPFFTKGTIARELVAKDSDSFLMSGIVLCRSCLMSPNSTEEARTLRRPAVSQGKLEGLFV